MMKNFWTVIKPWFEKEYYAAATFAFAVSFMMFLNFFIEDKVRSENDLQYIEGSVVEYSFKQGFRGSKIYYIWLENYGCTFQIPADYLHLFDEFNFRRIVNVGSKVVLFIRKSELKYLKRNKDIFVFHVNDPIYTYLSQKDTIEIEMKPMGLYGGFGFLIGGIMYLLIRKFLWKPKKVKGIY